MKIKQHRYNKDENPEQPDNHGEGKKRENFRQQVKKTYYMN